MLIKFKLIDWDKDENWKKFKNTYATKIRKASEIEQAESFMAGLIQGICCVTPEYQKVVMYDNCSLTFPEFRLTVAANEGEYWLDELEVEVETKEDV